MEYFEVSDDDDVEELFVWFEDVEVGPEALLLPEDVPEPRQGTCDYEDKEV